MINCSNLNTKVSDTVFAAYVIQLHVNGHFQYRKTN